MEKDEIYFLLKVKKTFASLNNRIHNKLACLAIRKFQYEEEFRNLTYNIPRATDSGPDIQGKLNNEIILVAEIKTTSPTRDRSGQLTLSRTQKEQILHDLMRLQGFIAKYKFFIVLDEKTKELVEKQLQTEEKFPEITIINPMQ